MNQSTNLMFCLIFGTSFLYSEEPVKESNHEPKTDQITEFSKFQEERNRTSPTLDAKHKPITRKSFSISQFSFVSIGAGLPAFSYNTNTQRGGFVDSFAPLNVNFNFFQRTFISWRYNSANATWLKDEAKISWWSPSIGIILVKKQESSEITFGISLVPLMLRYNDYAFGVGINWIKTGGDTGTVSIIVPITYQFNI